MTTAHRRQAAEKPVMVASHHQAVDDRVDTAVYEWQQVGY